LGLKAGYECSCDSYDRESMASKLGDGAILMCGGGNFGDRWPKHQQFRLRLLEDFPDNQIIIFPQTTGFLSNAYLRHCAEAFGRHSKVTICARDVVSEHQLKGYFPKARLCLLPDMAFMLGHMRRKGKPRYNVVWLARTDQEAVVGKQLLAA